MVIGHGNRLAFDYGQIPVFGGDSLVNANRSDTANGGGAFSHHYDDQTDPWRTGGMLPMPWTDEGCAERARGHADAPPVTRVPTTRR